MAPVQAFPLCTVSAYLAPLRKMDPTRLMKQAHVMYYICCMQHQTDDVLSGVQFLSLSHFVPLCPPPHIPNFARFHLTEMRSILNC